MSSVSASDNVTADDNLTLEDDSPLEHADEDVLEASSKLVTNDLVKYYKNESQFEFKVIDSKNNPISGADVVLKVHGSEYNKTTNKMY